MTTEELVARVSKAETDLATAESVYQEKVKASKSAQEETTAALSAVNAAKSEVAASKRDLMFSLGGTVPQPEPIVIGPNPPVNPNPVNTQPVNPVVRPRHVQASEPSNAVLYVLIAIAAIVAASYFGVIDVHNPFKPGPGPNPPPAPAPAVTDPIHAVYIYDKNNVNQDVAAIRNSTETIQAALKPLDATYRAQDYSDDESKKYYDNVIKSVNKFPFLILQNSKSGKLIGSPIMAPVAADDIINAVKNVRNGK